MDRHVQNFERIKASLALAVRQGQAPKAQIYFKELERAVAQLSSSVDDGSASLVAKMKAFHEEQTKALDTVQETKLVSSIKRQLESKKQWVERSRNSPTNLTKFTAELSSLVDEKRREIERFDSGKALLQEYDDFLGTLPSAGNLALETEANRLIQSASGASMPLKRSLSMSRPRQTDVDRFAQALEKALVPLQDDKFGELASVKDYLKECKGLLRDASNLEAKQRRDSVIAPVKRLLDSLQRATSSGRPKEMKQFADEVDKQLQVIVKDDALLADESISEFVSQCEERVRDARSAISKAKVDAIMGSDARRILSQIRFLEQSVEQGDAQRAQKTLDECKAILEPMVAKFGSTQDTSVLDSLKDIQDKLSAAEKAIPQLMAAAEIDSSKRALESEARWLENAIHQEHLSDITKYRESLQQNYDKFLTKFAAMSVGPTQTVFQEATGRIAPLLAKSEEQLAAIGQKQEIEVMRRSCEQHRKWMDQHIANGDITKATESRNALIESSRPFLSQLDQLKGDNNVQGHRAFAKELTAAIEDTEKKLASLMGEQQANGLCNELKSKLKWLEDAIRHRDEIKAMEYKEQSVPIVGSLRQFAAGQAQAKSAVADAESTFARLDSELGAIIAEKEIGTMSRAIQSTLSWLRTAVRNKDIDRVIYLSQQLEPQAAELRAKYGSHDKAGPVLDECDKASRFINKDLGTMIAKREASQFEGKIRSVMGALENFIGKKDVNQVMRYREQLTQIIADSSSVRDNPHSRPVMDKVEALMKKCDTELGAAIAQSRLDQLRPKFNALFKIAREAAQREELPAVQATLNRLNALVWPLRVLQHDEQQKHGTYQELLDELDHGQCGELGNCVELNDFMKQELDRVMENVKPVVDRIENDIHTPAEGKRQHEKVIVAELRQVNKKWVTQLRRQFLFDKVARELLLRLDVKMLRLTGAVESAAEEDQLIPTSEVSFKMPTAVQKVLKAINQQAEQINGLMRKTHETFTKASELLVVVETQQDVPLGQGMDAMETIEATIKDINDIYLPRLDKAIEAAQEVRDHAGCATFFGMLDESRAAADQQIATKLDQYKRRIAYVDNYNYALHVATEAGNLLREGSEISDAANRVINLRSTLGIPQRLDHLTLVPQALRMLAKVYKHMQHASQSGDESAPHAELGDLSRRVANLRDEALSLQISYSTKWSVRFATKSNYESSEKYLKVLQQVAENPFVKQSSLLRDFPANLKKLKTRVSEIRAENEERIRKEQEERRRKEEEERRRQEERARELKKQWVESFSEGTITGLDGQEQWEYKADGRITCAKSILPEASGLVIEWNGSKMSVIEKQSKSLDFGFGSWEDPVFQWRSRKEGAILKYTMEDNSLVKGGLTGSKSAAIDWTWDEKKQTLTCGTGAWHVGGGPVPFMVVLAVAMTRMSFERISTLRKDREYRERNKKRLMVEKVYGRIQWVDSAPDYKVKVVDSFEDLDVKKVSSLPNSVGEWQIVDTLPDFRVSLVSSFEDFSIKFVSSFPGIGHHFKE